MIHLLLHNAISVIPGSRVYNMYSLNSPDCPSLFEKVFNITLEKNTESQLAHFNFGIRAEIDSLSLEISTPTFPSLSCSWLPGTGVFSGNAANMEQFCPTKRRSIILML